MANPAIGHLGESTNNENQYALSNIFRTYSILTLIGSSALAMGCGGSDPTELHSGAGAGGAAGSDNPPGIGGGGGETIGLGGYGGITHIGGLDGLPSDNPDGGATPPIGGEPCTPEPGIDSPDDSFLDTNCDGIDGDIDGAVFVASHGVDGASGTIQTPVRTIQEGIQIAITQGKEVYICHGVYPENLFIENASVSLYGGYDCENGWKRKNNRVLVAPEDGLALNLLNVEDSQFDRIHFLADHATKPGGYAIAVAVEDSDDIQFSHAQLTAGNAGAGEAGAPPESSDTPAPTGGFGVSTTVDQCATTGFQSIGCQKSPLGGIGPIYECPNGDQNKGGPGGLGGHPFQSNAAGGPGHSGLPGGGAGGKPGSAGSPGAHGFSGLPGESALPTIPASDGQDGQLGVPGRPGGGGAGGSSKLLGQGNSFDYFTVGGGGGQGGYGGCGGTGGKGGKAGGSSIALIFAQSNITLSWSIIQSGNGGRGGDPGDGAMGQLGGAGGLGGQGSPSWKGSDGHPGGSGGNGGKGGPGSPGGGGSSIGIFAIGSTPLLESVTFYSGLPGQGGTAIQGPNGPDGQSLDTYSVAMF